LGFLYLNSLAHRVRAMRSPDEQGPAPAKAEGPALSKAEGTEQAVEMSSGVGGFIRVFLFAIAVLIGGTVLVSLWMLLAGTAVAIAPLLGLLVWAFGMGLGSYMFFVNLTNIGTAQATSLSSVTPLFSSILAVKLLGEQVTSQLLLGILITIAGVWLVI